MIDFIIYKNAAYDKKYDVVKLWLQINQGTEFFPTVFKNSKHAKKIFQSQELLFKAKIRIQNKQI